MEINESQWLDYIDEEYGVRIGEGRVYADQRGYVYAGSEYVATLGATSAPEDAKGWAKTIAHFPRHLKRMEVAVRHPAIVESENSTLFVPDHTMLSYEQLRRATDIFECDHCGDGDALRSGEACAYCGFDKDKGSR